MEEAKFNKDNKDKFDVFKSILENNFDFNDEKVQNIMKDLYSKHGEPMFNSNVYKIYQDILKVNKKMDETGYNGYKSKVYATEPDENYPFTNKCERTLKSKFVYIDVICPGVDKNQIELTVEADERKVFLCVKGTPWYSVDKNNISKVVELEIGDIFIKKYDISHYNVDINRIESQYKDGILSIVLPVKEEYNGQNFKIPIK